MATTWQFWADAGLTTPAVGGATVVDGGSPTDRIVYFGSAAEGKTLQAASDPGTDPVEISPADAAVGSGIDVTAVSLALSAGGLDVATPGDPLVIGTTLSSGVANAVAVFVRTAQDGLGIGSYADLSLTTNALVEA